MTTDTVTTHIPGVSTTATPTIAARLAIVVGATILLGFSGGVAAAAVLVWGVVGTPSRVRVFALAGLVVVAVAVSWLAAGVPTAQQVGAFTNLGGRGWLDAMARLALGLAAGAACLPGTGKDGNPGTDRPGTRTRLPEVDRMRAIAIVAVVFIHGLPFRAPITDYLDYWLSDLTRFAVPTLLVLAGWLVPGRPVGRRWVGRRLARIVPAYLMAATCMIVLARLTPTIDARPILESILFGDAVGPYYFIPVLVLLVVATPLFSRLPERASIVLLVVAAAGSLAIEVADLSLYGHNHLPLTWLPWYLAGMVARPHRDRLVALAPRWWLPALLVATTMAMLLVLPDPETTPRRILTWLTMWSTLGALALAAMRRTEPATAPIWAISRSSYVIYLYHPPVVAGMAGVFGSAILTLRPLTATGVAVVLGVVATSLAALGLSHRGARWFGATS